MKDKGGRGGRGGESSALVLWVPSGEERKRGQWTRAVQFSAEPAKSLQQRLSARGATPRAGMIRL